MTSFKRYIGDGAYVDYDGHNIILTTENGIRETNRVVLEPIVLTEYLKYVEEIKQYESDNPHKEV